MATLHLIRRLPASLHSRPALAGLVAGVALALTGCSQVAVIKSAPASVASFDSHYGNNPLAAADARSLEDALKARGQAWSIRLQTQPAAAGNVDVSNLNQLVAARGRVQDFAMVLTATAQSTLTGFSSRGSQGEQAYLESLVQAIAGAGYGRITSVHIDVFLKSSHHSVLTWAANTGFVYKVLDGQP